MSADRPTFNHHDVRCATCSGPATCIGAYEGADVETPACDSCCGHGNEDGHCVPLEDVDPESLKAFEEVKT